MVQNLIFLLGAVTACKSPNALCSVSQKLSMCPSLTVTLMSVMFFDGILQLGFCFSLSSIYAQKTALHMKVLKLTLQERPNQTKCAIFPVPSYFCLK
jgi:hypothetical protein